MLSNTEFTMGPEDCLEIDILPNLPSSHGYQHIISMMEVFSRYLKGAHTSLKTSPKQLTYERRSMWHRYVQIAVMNYNTSYHESLGCEPTTVFHGRIPYNILDIKLGLKREWKKEDNAELTDELQKQIDEIHQAAKDNLIQSYLKYKR